MPGRPLVQVELSRERDVLASAGVQQYRLTVTNRDPINSVRVRIQVPMTKYESVRAWSAIGTGAGSFTASGTGAISDLTATLTAGGTSYLLYIINSTLTLPTGQLYGSSTLFPTVQVDQQPTGTAVVEPVISAKIMTSFVGDRSLSAFGTRANDKNSYIDEMQVATRLVMKSTTEAQAQALVDELDRGIAATPGAYDTYRSLNLIGGRLKVVTVNAAYAVLPDDGIVVGGAAAITVTLPAASVDAIGRRLIVKAGAGVITFAGGAVSNAVTGVLATKCVELVSDGTTWQVTGTLA